MSFRNSYRWLPRILAILFMFFLGFFALDAFETPDPIWKEVIGFLIHLTPVYAILIALVVSWRYPNIGGVLFLIFGGLLIYFFRIYLDPIALLSIAGTPILVGILFISQGFFRKKTKFI